MTFCFLVFWCLVVNCSFLYAERHDFKLDDFETESRKWKNPHSDVFSISNEDVIDGLPDLLGTARGAAQCDQVHAAIEACQSHLLSLNQRVRNTDINVQRFVKQVIRIYDESKEYHEGVIIMKITSEDMQVLKSFASDGKFSSHSYNNIHDLLRVIFTVPPKSMLDRILPFMNMFAWIAKVIWDFALYIFQETRFLLMQFVFSADVVIYLSMILPTFVCLHALRKGYSPKRTILHIAVTVMMIAYFVELRSAVESARAKDLSKLARSRNIPPECKGGEMGFYDWSISVIRSVFFADDRCEKYFRDQVPETLIEPAEVFWKILLSPLTVTMEKFGHGLRLFIASFGGNLGWFSSIVIVPVGILALLYFLSILLAFIGGGSMSHSPFGRLSFSNRWSSLTGPSSTETSTAQAPSSTSAQPAVSSNINYTFNFLHPSQPTPSQITGLPATNMTISVPEGPVLQINAPNTNNPSNSVEAVVPQSMITAAKPEINHDSVGKFEETVALLGPSQSNALSSAGFSREQQLTGISETSHENLTKSARCPPLVSAFSEFEHNLSVDSDGVSSHCALEEIGSGDFVSRDLTHRILPSGVIRWRRHHRKFSL